jgi:Calx-beta domain
VTVNFATAPGSASDPGDYQSTNGTLTFIGGDTSEQVAVPVVGNTVDGPDRTFFVNLSGPGGARISDAQGVATIVDDDVPEGAGPPGPVGTPGPLLDATAPLLALGGARSQRFLRAHSVVILVRCDEPCTVSAAGNVSVPGASRLFRLKRVTRLLRPGVRSKLRLPLSRRAQAAIRRALVRRRRVVATVRVSARDGAGNSRSATRRIRLKR